MEYIPVHGGLMWLRVIIGFLCVIAAVWGGTQAFLKGYRASPQKEEEPVTPPPEVPISETWAQLCVRADKVIVGLIYMLPDDIKDEARKVPYLFKERLEKESDGYITLGNYHNFVPGRKSEYMGPIFLFLRSIEDVCAKSGEDFDAKVATTYLHELGHHFGWDEVDLVRHGLPSGRPPGE
jgi:predicted Zn-dependent protease with MMP-like domain